MSSVLEAQGIGRVFETGAERLEVLSSVDLSVEKGEMLAIMGPSGTGKSTLLHILGGLDRPTSGRVLLDSLDIFSYSSTRLPELRNEKVGFVFQFHHLLAEFTVLENVALPLLIAGRTQQAAFVRAREVLGELGFTNRLSHRPAQLSGGEKSKAAVARALVNDPAVVLADEPTGNLDAASAAALMDLLESINRERSVSMVVVTHNRATAARAARTLNLAGGRLVPHEEV
jgi:lipoprotein-releasing system ATP-binding protein